MNLPIPTEFEEQCLLVEWLELKGYKFTMIPNATYNPHRSQQLKNRRSGLRPGFPDMVVIVNGTLLCIELKRQKGGVLSPEQKEWHDCLNNCNGVKSSIAYGFDDAIKIIESLL